MSVGKGLYNGYEPYLTDLLFKNLDCFISCFFMVFIAISTPYIFEIILLHSVEED